MKILCNGKYRDMTLEEINNFNVTQEKLNNQFVPFFPEERIEELEAQLAALTEGYAEGVEKA